MKPIKPVDRALADLSRQIETVEHQLRAMGHATSAPAAVVPRKSASNFLREILTPPARRQAVRPRRDLFDVPVNPMQELNATSVTTSVPPAQTELFTPTNAGTRLTQFIITPPKPILKHVQRENRHRFYLWLGLSCVAVWLIYAVVR